MIVTDHKPKRVSVAVYGEFSLADYKEFEELVNYKVKFEGPVETSAGPLYVLSQGIDWVPLQSHDGYHLTIYIAENDALFHTGLAAYRRTLFGWLAALGLALLVLQQILLRWSFSPLRRVARDLARIERGGAERLVGPYPREVSVLTRGLNRFIESEREHLARYRNTLDDLAHSLKTRGTHSC